MNDHTTKIKELENELKHKDIKVNALEDQLQKQLNEIRTQQEKNKASNIEIEQLAAKVKDLEQRLYPAGWTIFRTFCFRQ